MSMMITDHLFAGFLKCPTKCYLSCQSVKQGLKSPYTSWIRTQNKSYLSEGIKCLVEGVAPGESIR